MRHPLVGCGNTSPTPCGMIPEAASQADLPHTRDDSPATVTPRNAARPSLCSSFTPVIILAPDRCIDEQTLNVRDRAVNARPAGAHPAVDVPRAAGKPGQEVTMSK